MPERLVDSSHGMPSIVIVLILHGLYRYLYLVSCISKNFPHYMFSLLDGQVIKKQAKPVK